MLAPIIGNIPWCTAGYEWPNTCPDPAVPHGAALTTATTAGGREHRSTVTPWHFFEAQHQQLQRGALVASETQAANLVTKIAKKEEHLHFGALKTDDSS